jgi:hypothetical protein
MVSAARDAGPTEACPRKVEFNRVPRVGSSFVRKLLFPLLRELPEEGSWQRNHLMWCTTGTEIRNTRTPAGDGKPAFSRFFSDMRLSWASSSVSMPNRGVMPKG